MAVKLDSSTLLDLFGSELGRVCYECNARTRVTATNSRDLTRTVPIFKDTSTDKPLRCFMTEVPWEDH